MQKIMTFALVIFLALIYLISLNQTRAGVHNNPEMSLEEATVPLIIERLKAVSEYSFVMEPKIDNTHIPVMPSESRIWVRGESMRLESTQLSDSGLPLITHGIIFHGKDEEYQYRIDHDRAGTYASLMSFALFQGSEGETHLSLTASLSPDRSRILGQERIFNRTCFVLENPGGKVWIDARDFVPLRIEYDGVMVEFKNMRSGPDSVTNEDLQIPADAVEVNHPQLSP